MSRDIPSTTGSVHPVDPVSVSHLASAAGTEPIVLGSFCTGYGGLDLGVTAAFGGVRLAWCADPDPHVATVLAARFAGVPNLGDIRSVDWHDVEPVDVITAGFPCQDISSAGKRAGIEKGERSGIWKHIALAVRILRPNYVVVENVAALRWRNGGLGRVLGDLAEAGYDALWRSVRASDIGAPHRRERVFILGARQNHLRDVADAVGARRNLQRPQCTRPTRQPNLVDPAATPVADTDGSRLPVGCDPNRPPSRASDPERVCHADRLRPAPAHPDGLGRQELYPSDPARRTVPVRPSTTGQDETATHASGDRRDEGRPEPARIQGRPHAVLNRPFSVDDLAGTAAGVTNEPYIDWGIYAPAVEHWERVLGRPAPYPTQAGRHGRPVLSARFTEWLMGLEDGHVSALDIPRTAQLRLLGNGVVPQQAELAVRLLLADLTELHATHLPQLHAAPGVDDSGCCCRQHKNARCGGRAA